MEILETTQGNVKTTTIYAGMADNPNAQPEEAAWKVRRTVITETPSETTVEEKWTATKIKWGKRTFADLYIYE